MAIIQEKLEGHDNIMHTYSDQNLKIRQVETGIIYDTADDVIPVRYTYEETDMPIKEDTNGAEESNNPA